MELEGLHSVGKVRIAAMRAAGICSLRDLLYCVPVAYKDLSVRVTLAQARPGQRSALSLRRAGEPKVIWRGKQSRVLCPLADETGVATGIWFNQPWVAERLRKQESLLLYGPVERFAGKLQLTNPSIEDAPRIVAVYRPIEGLPQKTHEKIVLQALSDVDALCEERLPAAILSEYDLMPCPDAIRALHRPQSMALVARAQRRIAFEQALLYQAAVRLMAGGRAAGLRLDVTDEQANAFWETMPYEPTKAQRRTLLEIAADLRGDRAMARMVQGDVGCGKTAVALGAMLLTAKAGYQAALMAPTELLARQHFSSIEPCLRASGVACGLLTGGMKAAQRREALDSVADGRWQVVVGTHALISKSVRYARLGLCVTDEQHRFGVNQRTALMNKGRAEHGAPHLLVMSATPIPRSLALMIFGDLDVSVIDELPPGRKPVRTRLVPEAKREGMYDFLRRELRRGRQAYIVCPLVEESDEGEKRKAVRMHADALRAGPLSGHAIGVTYGAQPSEEKQEALEAFAQGRTGVLVATTVIEVGVNVPNATIMIVENADNYGLAQLHQIRGRVGRGSDESWCFLMGEPNERLRALTSTNDGFEIAKRDLELRGPGELLGTRQHGIAIPAAACGDMRLLHEVADAARRLEKENGEAWRTLCALASGTLRALAERISIS